MAYRFGPWLACAIAALAACGGEDGAPSDASVEPREVTLQFEARVGSEPARCGQTYAGLGNNKRALRIGDLRWYVFDVQLINAAGKAVPVNLPDDGEFQAEQVAMLDFEDKSGACSNGSAETNHVVKGSVPEGDYRGVRFRVGMPPAVNHANSVQQKPPLSIQSMVWSWRLGHKFFRLDVELQPEEGLKQGGFEVHLGAARCTGTQGSFTCANENTPAFEFDAFDAERDQIVLDVAPLMEGIELKASDTPGVSIGCTATPEDADCVSMFEGFGLTPETGKPSATPQRAFRVEAR